MKHSHNRGLIKLLLVLVVAIIVLGYFRIDLRAIVESEPVQNNLRYVGELLKTAWQDYLREPIIFIWDNFKALLGRLGLDLTN